MLEGASSFLYKTMTQRERLLSLPDEEFIRYKEDELYGYKSSSGEILIPARFSHAPERASERMEVWIKGKCGYINKAAEEIMPIIYDDLIGYCYETHPDVEMFLAEKDGKFGRFDNDDSNERCGSFVLYDYVAGYGNQRFKSAFQTELAL